MYTIEPIEGATLDATKGSFTYLVDEGKPLTIPVISFLVTANDSDDDTVVLVDTGLKEPDEDGTVNGREVAGGGPGPLRDVLAERGLAPEDVDTVVLTHLHYDHCSNNDLFPEAEFVVQGTELEAARDPLPPFERVYDEENIATLDELDITIVDGNHRLREGIELLHAPGHTEGMQAVVVETADGPHALVGDLAYCEQNLDPGVTAIVDGNGETIETTPVEYDYLPPGILVDVEACYDSVDRLRERVGEDGRLLPGHGGEILGETFG